MNKLRKIAAIPFLGMSAVFFILAICFAAIGNTIKPTEEEKV